jgi:hypothetical protein
MSTRMSQGDLADRLRPAVAILRIIVAAVAGGALVFIMVAMYLRQAGYFQGAPADFNFLTPVAVGWGVAALAASWLVPAKVARAARRSIVDGTYGDAVAMPGGKLHDALAELGEAGKLLGAFQSQLIVGLAFMESGALLGALVYLLNGSPIALGLAIGLVGAMVARFFPSAARMAEWIDVQQRLVDEERSLVGRDQDS